MLSSGSLHPTVVSVLAGARADRRHAGVRGRQATRIWLDRSFWHLTHIDGTFYECGSGRLAEAMYLKNDSIKIHRIKIKVRELHDPTDPAMND